MSTLLLVRHAQASFLAADYDELSDLGRAQARKLGEHWAGSGVSLHALFVGPRRRQRQTAETVLEVLTAEGKAAPELVELGELDEYPAEEVLRTQAPELAVTNARFAQWVEAMQGADSSRERGRALDRMLRLALERWSLGGHSSAEHESWAEFGARIERALGRLVAHEGLGLTVAAFSSAGTIGALVARVLGAPASAALDLGFMLNNSALTELAFSPGRVGLTRFNVLPHLPNPGEWTRR